MVLILRLIGNMMGALKVPVDPGSARKVLIADLSFIGDIVMTAVTHNAVRRNLPGAAIHVLGFPAVRTILPLLPAVDALHDVPKEGKLAQVATALRLRRERFDIAIHLNTGLWVNFLVWLTGARVRVGYDFEGRGCFHQVRIPIRARTVRLGYRREECLRLVNEAFGWNAVPQLPALTMPGGVTKIVMDRLAERGVGGADFLVGIHTNSRQDREIRCWEEQKFAEVANHLIERYNAKIIFTDIPADRERVEPIRQLVRRPEMIVGDLDTTIPELYALLKRIDLLLTINTAPLHLAVDAGTPLVAILGYAPGHIYFPPGDERFQWVEDPAFKDSDAEEIRKTRRSKVKEIPVWDVLEKVEYLIRRVVPRTAGKAPGGAQ